MAVQTQIQTRRGTAATWTSTNPTLAAGEIGFESDTGKFKIGTGSTAWASLAYATNGAVVSPLTTKGDLFTYSTTNARLAVGNNGESLVADSSTSTGLRYQTGVSLNGVINGAMDIWQRGTSFASTGNIIYTADRWGSFRAALGQTVSRQTASLEGFQYSLRSQRDSGNTSTAINYVFYSMETNDSVRYANKTVTLSFWAKAGANYSSASSALTVQWTTGTGTDQTIINGYTGSGNVIATSSATLTTSWQRFSYTGTAVSNTNEMGVLFANTPVGTAGANDWFEITGVQVEFGSVATNFKRAGGGTIQGELAACMRYYQRINSVSLYGGSGAIARVTSTAAGGVSCYIPTSIPLRTTANAFDSGGAWQLYGSGAFALTTLFNIADTPNTLAFQATSSGATINQIYTIISNNNTASYLAWSAEL